MTKANILRYLYKNEEIFFIPATTLAFEIALYVLRSILSTVGNVVLYNIRLFNVSSDKLFFTRPLLSGGPLLSKGGGGGGVTFEIQ